jgi:cysteine desulfuration protein SufE
LKNSLHALLETISDITDRETLGEFLIETAARYQDLPTTVCQRPYPEDHRIVGCESEVYLWLRYIENRSKFFFAVENPQGISAKALAVILDESFSGLKREELHTEALSLAPDLVFTIFGRNLTIGRGQGLQSMVATVKRLALS